MYTTKRTFFDINIGMKRRLKLCLFVPSSKDTKIPTRADLYALDVKTVANVLNLGTLYWEP